MYKQAIRKAMLRTGDLAKKAVSRTVTHIADDSLFRQHFYQTNPHHHTNFYADELAQRQLLSQYRMMKHIGAPMQPWDDIGFRALSQFNEDGILLYIFAYIGFVNRLCLEIGSNFDGSPVYRVPQNNTANLMLNHDCSGLVIDGNAEHVLAAQSYISNSYSCCGIPPKICCEFVTAENIDSLISGHGMQGEIDLFSLDVDGVDYWLWDALTVVSPRVVIVEYNRFWRTDDSVVIPYRADFVGHWADPNHPLRDFYGASLPAFVKLGKKKGYRLAGFNIFRNNAFFIRDGVGEECFPEVDYRLGYEGVAFAMADWPVRPHSENAGWERV